MSSEVDDTIKRIMAQKGVTGILVTSGDGVPIKTTMDNSTSILYASLVTQLCDKARCAVRDLDSSNDLTFLRLRSEMHEILVAPDVNFLLIVVQVPEEDEGTRRKGKKGSDEEEDDSKEKIEEQAEEDLGSEDHEDEESE